MLFSQVVTQLVKDMSTSSSSSAAAVPVVVAAKPGTNKAAPRAPGGNSNKNKNNHGNAHKNGGNNNNNRNNNKKVRKLHMPSAYVHPRVYKAHLRNGCVMVRSPLDVDDVYNRGIYGKPMLRKGAPIVGDDFLVLSDVETLFLVKLGALEVTRDVDSSSSSSSSSIGPTNRPAKRRKTTAAQSPSSSSSSSCSAYGDKKGDAVGVDALWTLFTRKNPRFPCMYAVYHYLRARGWVPRSGLKYAADFVVYKFGPSHTHAEYCVNVKGVDAELRPVDEYSRREQRLGGVHAGLRMTHTVAKDMLLAYVVIPSDCDMSSPACLPALRLEFRRLKRWDPTSTRDTTRGETKMSDAA
jgi:tRNA splicing endonuclease